MTPDLSDLVHCVFSVTVQNVPQRIVGASVRARAPSEGYVRLWEGANVQREAEVSKCDPLSTTMALQRQSN